MYDYLPAKYRAYLEWRDKKDMEDVNEYVFTFGCGHELEGKCVRIAGTYEEARAKMVEKYGQNWAFQYSAEEWDAWKKDPNRAWYMEQEIPFEE